MGVLAWGFLEDCGLAGLDVLAALEALLGVAGVTQSDALPQLAVLLRDEPCVHF